MSSRSFIDKIKSSRIILSLNFTLVLLLFSYQHINAQATFENWSGSISFSEKFKGLTGWSDKMIDVSFTNGKGSGTITYKDMGPDIVNGKVMAPSTCTNQGVAELQAIDINYGEKTYYIHVTAPDCTPGDERGKGNSGSDIIVADKPLGGNPNLLSGSDTKVVDLPGGQGTITTTVKWNFVRKADVELIVTLIPDKGKYDDWLPEPGKDEFTKGNVMNISLKTQGKNGKPSVLKAESFELRLTNTSREPGITINYPVSPQANQLPDLRFLPFGFPESTDEDQFTTIPCNDGFTGKMRIGSYDGGGWTTLTVVANLEDNSQIEGMLLVSGGDKEILIPKRTVGSKIATAWLTANGDPGEMDDKESTKKMNGNGNDGDGLTAYEEYRGVISEGKYKRLDPNKKEVGINATQTDFSLFKEGISWFKNASGLEIVRFDFDKDETAPSGRINNNAKSAHDFDQFAIYLLNGGIGRTGTLGITYGHTNLWIPANITSVVIDWDYIQIVYKEKINEVKPGILKFTLQEYLAQTVAHELGHAVNVDHHGDDRRLDRYDAILKKYAPYVVAVMTNMVRIFDLHGNLITTRPYTIFNIGSVDGNVESGDLSCMLNYYPYYSWGYTRGADGADIYNQEPLIPLGKTFCKSKIGTGFNATKLYFGDATKGNCLGQIQLRN